MELIQASEMRASEYLKTLKELKQCCKEEWTETLPQLCDTPIKLYQLLLVKVDLEPTASWEYFVE